MKKVEVYSDSVGYFVDSDDHPGISKRGPRFFLYPGRYSDTDSMGELAIQLPNDPVERLRYLTELKGVVKEQLKRDAKAVAKASLMG